MFACPEKCFEAKHDKSRIKCSINVNSGSEGVKQLKIHKMFIVNDISPLL